jgi:hypothetical protein
MDKLRDFLWPKRLSYKPVEDEDGLNQDLDPLMGQQAEATDLTYSSAVPFFWLYYAVFTLLGVAMLWAWYVWFNGSDDVVSISGTDFNSGTCF